MNYEKKYKESLERAKEQLDGAKAFDYDNEQTAHNIRTTVYNIFPELKESEDEKIRREIKAFIKSRGSQITQSKTDAWIAWIDKQGEQKLVEWHREDEQNLNVCLSFIPHEHLRRWLKDTIHAKYDKPTNKVEPKFKEGDWLCENEPNNYARFIQILEIVDVQDKERYRISRDIHNDEDIVELDFVEKNYHKFDIQDAKDGDVRPVTKKEEEASNEKSSEKN